MNNQVPSLQIPTWIPLVISGVSLIISAFLAIRLIWQERFHIDFEMIKWFGGSPKDYPFFLWLSVVNYSKAPCSIIEVNIIGKRNSRKLFAIGNGNKRVIAGSKGEEVYSLDYPVNLASYGSAGGYFHLSSDIPYNNFEECTVKITVKTNRGSKTKDIFLDRGKNIFRVMQNNSNGGLYKGMKREDGSTIVDYPDARL